MGDKDGGVAGHTSAMNYSTHSGSAERMSYDDMTFRRGMGRLRCQ